jgi:predicted HTH domain antitoxin
MTPQTSAIRVPFDVGSATKMSQEELRTELAVHLYQRQKLSLGKARELAGLTVWQFLQLLGSRSIPVNYNDEQFEEDVATLKRLGRP